ncbi:hypothetical protein COOONC_09223, partial [Cooperia oncophora]
LFIKALVACRLYKSLATEAAEDYLEVEICDELKKYAEEFRTLSLELLEHCYHQDDAQTLQLLTYELSNWGCQTCLSLAVMVNNKQFLAHPCRVLLEERADEQGPPGQSVTSKGELMHQGSSKNPGAAGPSPYSL